MKKYVRLLPLLGLMLVGCAQSAVEVSLPENAASAPPALPVSAGTSSSASVPLARLWQAAGHPVIYQGSMELEVASFAAASTRLDTILARRGAYLTEARETTDANRHQQVLTIRVPSAQFLALTADVAQVGNVQSKELTSRDIAAELVKLHATTRSVQADTTVRQTAAQDSQLLTKQATLATLRLTYFQLRPITDISPAEAIGPQVQVALWYGWRMLGKVLVVAAYCWPLLLGLMAWALYRRRRMSAVA